MIFRLQYHYILASLFTLALIVATVLWVVDSRLKDFRATQILVAEDSVHDLATEVSRALAEKYRLAALFRDNEAALIARVIEAPEDNALRAHLQQRLKIYFPDSFAFTLANHEGDLLIDEFDGLVDQKCLSDIRAMATKGNYRVRIHPSHVRYHYDIIVPFDLESQQGVFFVSFVPGVLARLIAAIQHPGHELLLASTGATPMIEVTQLGGRDQLERTDFRLAPDELTRILATQDVAGTDWKAMALAQAGLFNDYAVSIWRQAGFVFSGFALTSLILMIGSVHVESKRAEVGRALEEAKADLERRVERRTQQLHERNQQLRNEIAAREEIEWENERLAAFPRENPNPIIVCDLEGIVIYYNPAAAQAVQRMDFPEIGCLLPPQHKAILAILPSSILHTMEAPISTCTYEFTYHAHTDLGMVYVHLCDITERTAAQARLKRSEQFLRHVTAVLAEGLMVLDKHSNVFFMNPEAERILGWKQEDLANHNVHYEIHQHQDEGIALTQCPTRIALQQGTVERVEEDVFFHRSGRRLPVSYTAAPMRDGTDIIGVVVAFQDISNRKRMEEKILYMATYDSLTGVYNRATLDQKFSEELQRAKRYGREFALFMIDIDYFKRINDCYGHQAGDAVLLAFAQTLKNAIRQSDFIGRFGGEEFVVVLPETSLASAAGLAERLRQSVANSAYAAEHGADSLRLTISVGVAAYPDHGATEKALFAAADAAVYRAKKLGRNQIQVATARADDPPDACSVC
jgi:diguanylate cyclase (GGDEF)-like protein/PAS domain S-box-containing protein